MPTIVNNWTRGAARQMYHHPNQPQAFALLPVSYYSLIIIIIIIITWFKHTLSHSLFSESEESQVWEVT